MTDGIRITDLLLDKETFDNEGLSTKTSNDQENIEESLRIHANNQINYTIFRKKYIYALQGYLRNLPGRFQSLDASQPWICYWIIHSLSLLNAPFSSEMKNEVIEFLKRCQSPTGGYGGGPQQDAHLAPTYAAINALCIIGTEEAYNSIDRKNLLKFLHRMKQPNGSFLMHEDGEADVRGAFCALSVASITNIINPKLCDKTGDWILQCQTYEGGFGGTPGCEAHGGYTFCAFAALNIVKMTHIVDMKSLMRWLANCQMRYEGGFQGRTNKLVDSCYSFWQGGSFLLLHRILNQHSYYCPENWLFNQEALQKYILVFCQSDHVGMCDKPQNKWDFYHTCYALSGLSVAQHAPYGKEILLFGEKENLLNPTHPIYNIGIQEAYDACRYFGALPVPDINNENL